MSAALGEKFDLQSRCSTASYQRMNHLGYAFQSQGRDQYCQSSDTC